MLNAALEQALDVEIEIERKEKRDALAEQIFVAMVSRDENYSVYAMAHKSFEMANVFYEIKRSIDNQD